MNEELTKELVINNKKDAIKKLNKLLETYINDSSNSHLKKAFLLSKWIKQYTNYISFEEIFSPKKMIRYQRGDIVFANFGFNIGSELGGEHYSIVIDKENARNASTVTVIPLSSYKPENGVHPNDLFLGNELYDKLKLKLKTQITHLREKHNNNNLLLNMLKEKLFSCDFSEDQLEDFNALEIELKNRQKKLDLEITNAERIKDELSSLKEGSVAKVQQITTISKIRIYNPKNSNDPLYGIRLSEESLEKLNTKIKDFFVF